MGRGGDDGAHNEAEGAHGEEGAHKHVEHSIKVLYSAMPSSYEKDAIEVFIQASEKYRNYRDMARYCKKEYDERYPSSGKATDGVYHCIVGSHFAASVTHEVRFYTHVQVDLTHFVLFKSKDSPFDVESVPI